MARHTEHAAQREAKNAAKIAEGTRLELQQATLLEKERIRREKEKAQRMLMRSIRSSGGGFFESDTAAGSTLGSSGTLG